MKATFTERNLVVILFVMVIIIFSLAQEDSKKKKQFYGGGISETTKAVGTAFNQPLNKLGIKEKDPEPIFTKDLK